MSTLKRDFKNSVRIFLFIYTNNNCSLKKTNTPNLRLS